MCSTKALLAGDGDVIADIYRDRVLRRGKGAEVWGWATAYKVPAGGGQAPAAGAPASSAPPAAPQGGKS
jgi:formate dehydrogenase iron-sulfur subunit